MNIMRAYFISDIHIKEMEEENAKVLLRFLNRIITSPIELRATHLFLVGDIFDLWVGAHHYFVEKFKPLVDVLQKLVRLGIEVHYFEGNHDLHLKNFWKNKLGLHVHEGPWSCSYLSNSYRVRIEHGDFINPKDYGYRTLRYALRTRPMRWAALNLPDRWIARIGESASKISRQHTSNRPVSKDPESIKQSIRNYALKTSTHQENVDLLITGHVHLTDDFTFEGKGLSAGHTVRSVNLGCWPPAQAFLLQTKHKTLSDSQSSLAFEGQFISLADEIN